MTIKVEDKIVSVFILLIMFLFGGAYVYHNIENWRYIDALYFSAYTMTTIGYGDFTPKTDIGKIFSIFYMFSGVGVALYGISLMTSHFVETREQVFIERFGIIKFLSKFGENKTIVYKFDKLTDKLAKERIITFLKKQKGNKKVDIFDISVKTNLPGRQISSILNKSKIKTKSL